MSAPPLSAAAAASALVRGPPKKRPRHFWDGPDPTDEGDEEKQGAAHVAPVTRLYRHALESVFGFLSLKDLSRVLSVSRSWSAAVSSMKSIGASLETRRSPSPIVAASRSPLALHVSSLSYQSHRVSSNDLLLISRVFGSLTSLQCTMDMAHASRVSFAAMLRSLTLSLEGDESRVPIINDAIAVISRLPNLMDLDLTLPEFRAFDPALSFAPLATAARLQSLTVGCDGESLIHLPRHQQDQLRMLPHMRVMCVVGLHKNDLAYLLRTPHSLQWQEIHTVFDVDDAAASALSNLPSLTTLKTHDCRSVAFLPSLPRLRTLALCMDGSVRLAADIAAGLPSCTELTELTLYADDVTSQHLSQALSRLPLLRELTLLCCSALDSLSFLSECAHLAQSLQFLRIDDCRNAALHSTELKHILALKSLTELSIWRSFVEPLDSFAKHLLTPPSVVLPKLKHFSYLPN